MVSFHKSTLPSENCCKLLSRVLNQLISKQNAVSFHNEVLILNHSMLLKGMLVSKEYRISLDEQLDYMHSTDLVNADVEQVSVY